MRNARLLFIVLIFIGCRSSNNFDVVGEWSVVIHNTTMGQSTNAKQYLEFVEDGRTHWQIEFWEPSTGSWRISGDSIFLSTDKIEMKGTLIRKSLTELTLEVITLNEEGLQLRIDLERKD